MEVFVQLHVKLNLHPILFFDDILEVLVIVINYLVVVLAVFLVGFDDVSVIFLVSHYLDVRIILLNLDLG